MSDGERDQSKILNTLQRATLFLADLAGRGALTATPDDQKKAQNLVEALRYWRLTALADLFGRLRRLLSAGWLEGEGNDGRALSSTMMEAFYTCKAVKTYLRGRLDDPRLLEPLLGQRWKEEDLEVLPALRLVKVGEEALAGEGAGKALVREFFLEVDRGTLYRVERGLDPAAAPVSRARDGRPAETHLVKRALLIPDFPPPRLLLKESSTEPMTPETAGLMLGHAPGSFSVMITRYKAFRSNVFAPEDFYTFIRFWNVYSTGRDLYLVDGESRMLRLSRTSAPAASARFRHHVLYGGIEAVFGRLTVEGPDPVFVPLSVFHSKERKPIVILARDLA